MKTNTTKTFWNAIPCIHECLHTCMLIHTYTHTCIGLVSKNIFVHILMNKRNKQCSGRCVTFDCFVGFFTIFSHFLRLSRLTQVLMCLIYFQKVPSLILVQDIGHPETLKLSHSCSLPYPLCVIIQCHPII
jgi:hypothetical protein